MNTNLLKGKIRSNGKTQEKIANEIGISLAAFSAKVNGKTSFSLEEVKRLCTALNIESDIEKVDIFLR